MSARPSEASRGATATEPYRPTHPVRFITAASLFDGHDAAINLIRRLLQSHGAEVVHLGHNRSVADVVRALLKAASTETTSGRSVNVGSGVSIDINHLWAIISHMAGLKMKSRYAPQRAGDIVASVAAIDAAHAEGADALESVGQVLRGDLDGQVTPVQPGGAKGRFLHDAGRRRYDREDQHNGAG